MPPGPVPPSSGVLDVTWTELVYSALTVGRASLSHVVMYGQYSFFEMAFRANLLFANLMNVPNGGLIQTEIYAGMDPSEKSAVSYWLGLTAAKLFAARFLETDFLCHLDVYKTFPDPQYRIDPGWFDGGKKPDLVGQMRTGGWIAVEAKGRTNGFDKYAIERAKTEQLANLLTINSQAPRLKVAVESFFRGDEFSVYLEDPENVNKYARNLALPEKEIFLRHWYEPFLKLVDGERLEKRVEDDTFLLAEVAEMDIKVGIDLQLYKYLREQHGNVDDKLRFRQSRNGENWHLGKEGIFVELGPVWGEDNMSRQPYLRERYQSPGQFKLS